MYDTHPFIVLTIIIQSGPIRQLQLLVKNNKEGNLSQGPLFINLGIHLFFAVVKIMKKKVEISQQKGKKKTKWSVKMTAAMLFKPFFILKDVSE
jgi:hypothetical protein